MLRMARGFPILAAEKGWCKMSSLTIVDNLISLSSGRAVANQFDIWINPRFRIFQSYKSVICIIDFEKKVIYFAEKWNYSNTTHKWLNRWLVSCGFPKLLAKEYYRYNLKLITVRPGWQSEFVWDQKNFDFSKGVNL